MDLKIVEDLEQKIEQAVQLIACIKSENSKLEKENQSLKAQVGELQKAFEDYKSAEPVRFESRLAVQQEIDGQAVKARLEKLLGKLAALEDNCN